MVVLKLELQNQEEFDASTTELINKIDWTFMAIEQQIKEVSRCLDNTGPRIANMDLLSV